MDNIKRMDIKEFREEGFLQEVNRVFFHPLGLALEVNIDAEGNEMLGGVWDSRDDDMGFCFDCGLIDKAKVENVLALRISKAGKRIEEFGNIVQPC